MSRTKFSTLVRIAVVAGLFGWFLDSILYKSTGSYISVGAGTAIGFALIDMSMLIWAVMIRERLPKVVRDRNATPSLIRASRPLEPLIAARTAAIAKAASHTGAIGFGFYVGLVVYALPRIASQSAINHVVLCVPAIVGATAMGAIALWIERRCSPPSPPTEETATSIN
jgi:hypothetical protein